MVGITTMNDNYLIHYGVKGMKWGVRHDPIATGNKKSSFTLSNKQKKILKRVAIGAAITGGILLASYGAVKVNDIRNYKKISKAAKSAVQEVLRRNNRESMQRVRSEYSTPFYKRNYSKQELKDYIIRDYKEDVVKNRIKASRDEKELISEGYKEFKKLQKARVEDIIKPSYFGKKSSWYDPYRRINDYRKIGY